MGANPINDDYAARIAYRKAEKYEGRKDGAPGAKKKADKGGGEALNKMNR